MSMGVGGVVDVDIALGGTESNDDMECGVSGVACVEILAPGLMGIGIGIEDIGISFRP